MAFGGYMSGACCTFIFLGHWAVHLPTENTAVSCYFGASAPRYSRTEYIHVLLIIVSELKLRNVQRHVLGADRVERADNATFDRLATVSPKCGSFTMVAWLVQPILEETIPA
jgi:hypothetical protein